MDYSYVPIDRIFSKFIREVSSDFNEGDLVEMTGEALEFIGAVKYYEEAVAFIEINNHQGELPIWLHTVIQVGRDTKWTCKEDCVTIVDAATAMAQAQCKGKIQWQDNVVTPCKTSLYWDDDRSEYIMLDCNGTPIENYNIAYYRPYFDMRMEYGTWLTTGLYNRFSPVRLSTSNLYDTLVCRENGRQYGPDTYTIIRNKTIRCSFEKGMIAVAYNRQVVEDKTGYPLVPDDISYTTAIIAYIRKISLGKTEYGSPTYRIAEGDWQWYCKQASNKDLMPHGIDEHQNLLDQRQYLIPRMNAYTSFFGNLAKPEQRRFNDPDFRNKTGIYLTNG